MKYFDAFKEHWAFYPGALRVWENIYKKWNNRMVPGWSNVRSQLEMDERMSTLMHKYDKAN